MGECGCSEPVIHSNYDPDIMENITCSACVSECTSTGWVSGSDPSLVGAGGCTDFPDTNGFSCYYDYKITCEPVATCVGESCDPGATPAGPGSWEPFEEAIVWEVGCNGEFEYEYFNNIISCGYPDPYPCVQSLAWEQIGGPLPEDKKWRWTDCYGTCWIDSCSQEAVYNTYGAPPATPHAAADNACP
jgi:hypothetical protein